MTKYLTTAEVAERTRTSPGAVRHWRYQGTGPTGVRVGKRVLYAETDVDAWLESLRAAERTRSA